MNIFMDIRRDLVESSECLIILEHIHSQIVTAYSKRNSQHVSTVSTEAGLFSRRTLKYLITLCWIPLPNSSHSHLVVLSDLPSLLACFQPQASSLSEGGSVISTAPCSSLTQSFYILFLLILLTWLASLYLCECTLQKLAGRVYCFLLALGAKDS